MSRPPATSPKPGLPGFAAAAAACLGAALPARAEIPPIGEKFPVSRYEQIWQVSPFVAVTDLSGQADDMAGRFVLTGFARMGNQDVVFLFDRSTLERFSLRQGESRAGVSLRALEHNGDLASVRATLSAGDRTLDLRYDPNALSDGGASAHPGWAQGMNRNQPVPQFPQHRNQPYFPNQPHQVPQQPPLTPQQLHQMQMQQMQQMGQVGHPVQPAPNAIKGAAPAVQQAPEPPPPPRRVIRRRAIVAPE